MPDTNRPLAVITGASSGIGYEWAKCCARNNYDLIISANDPKIHEMAKELGAPSVSVETVEADMGTVEGVHKLYNTINGRHVAALLAYSGYGLAKNFLDEDFEKWKHVIDTNIIGTLYLVQKVARDMLPKKSGLILITGAVNEQTRDTYHAIYNGTKAFLDNFVFALRHELKDSGITITCLMPGDSETQFLEHARILDEQNRSKPSAPLDLAKTGIKEMMKGENEVIMSWQNMVQAAIASLSRRPELASEEEQARDPLNPSQRSAFMSSSSQSGSYGDKTQPNQAPPSQAQPLSDESRSETQGPRAAGECGAASQPSCGQRGESYQQARFTKESDKTDPDESEERLSQPRSQYGEGRGGSGSRGARGEYREQYGQSSDEGRSCSGTSCSRGEYDEERSSQPRSHYGSGSTGRGYGGEGRSSRGGEGSEDRYGQTGGRYGSSRGGYDEDMYSQSGGGYGGSGRSSSSRGSESDERYSQSGRGYGGGQGQYRSGGQGGYGGGGQGRYEGEYEQDRYSRSGSGYGGGQGQYGGGSQGDYGERYGSGSGSRYGSGSERWRSESEEERLQTGSGYGEQGGGYGRYGGGRWKNETEDEYTQSGSGYRGGSRSRTGSSSGSDRYSKSGNGDSSGRSGQSESRYSRSSGGSSSPSGYEDEDDESKSSWPSDTGGSSSGHA